MEGKLSERQSLVLTTLKEYCWEKEVGISPLTISTMLSDEYGKNGRVKALATLDQLTKKKLIIKQLISNKERGNTAVFYPREWGKDALHKWSAEKIEFFEKEATK